MLASNAMPLRCSMKSSPSTAAGTPSCAKGGLSAIKGEVARCLEQGTTIELAARRIEFFFLG
jgi:hypothetical protein